MEDYFKFFNSGKSEDSFESSAIMPKFCCTEYEVDSFLEKIKSGSMSKHLIRVVIYNNYDIYFNHDMFNNPRTRSNFQALWTNERFLTSLRELLQEDELFLKMTRKEYTTSLNTNFYDYYTNKEKDENIMNLMFDISSIINANYIIRMSPFLYKDQSILLAMTKYSYMNESICAQRFLRLIINYGERDNMSVQNIINILSIFFNDRFSILFNSLMIDIDDEMYNTFTEKEIIAYNNLYIAVLEILRTMSDIELKNLLEKYGSYIGIIQVGHVRLSLRKLPARYGRVESMANLVSNEGIFIP